MLKFYSRNLKTHQFINDYYKFRVATKIKFIRVHLSDCGLQAAKVASSQQEYEKRCETEKQDITMQIRAKDDV